MNPSGKLPATFPKVLADSPAHALNAYPGTNGAVNYVEGLLIGYRWFDTKNIAPQFPFGHGLSYTTFEYADLKLVSTTGDEAVVTAEFKIANSGKRAGPEVTQLYVQPVNPSQPRPFKELEGFKKVLLQPGEKQTVRLALDARAFAFYDPAQKRWVAAMGTTASCWSRPARPWIRHRWMAIPTPPAVI